MLNMYPSCEWKKFLGLWLVVVAAVLGGTVSTARAERPPSACLLPENTLLFVSVLDVPDTRERFSQTTIAGILNDPGLQPVVGDIFAAIDKRTAPLRETVGLTTDDLLNLPQGELTLALVPREKGQPAPVVLIDTGDHVGDAGRLIQAIVKRITEAGNKLSEREVRDTPVTVFESVGRAQENVAFFKRENTLVWSNDLDVLEKILLLWDGEDTATLAARSDFSTIMQGSRRLNPKPQVTWYVNPMAIFEESARDRMEMQVALMMVPALGLDGIKAVGGGVELNAGPYDSLWHAHLVLETPRRGVVDLVQLKEGKMTPPDWVPADVADYVTFHWDLPATLEKLRSLYDSFRGEGALDEFITSRVSGPLGADLVLEVLPAMTGRMAFMRWIEKPIAEENSVAGLLAVELLPEANGDELLRHVVQTHAVRFMKREFAGVVYYETVRPESAADQPQRRRRLTSPCVGIVDDTLMIADRESLLKNVVLTQSGGQKRLAEADDFGKMIQEMGQLTGGSAPVLVRFQRPAERTEAWYEPIRQRQQLEESERPQPRRGPFQGLQQAMSKHTLPPFDVLRQYFPPGGAVLVEDDAGLHYTGFTLKAE
ncbi:MAG: hypothetical protein ACYC6Y_13125 [Thermoguttaceae bacterium]